MDTMDDSSLNILQVSTFDVAGGAEKVAASLFQAYRKRGYASYLAVGQNTSTTPNVIEIPRRSESFIWSRLFWALHGKLSRFEGSVPGIERVRFWLRTIAGGLPAIEREMGREDFNFPGSRNLLDLPPRRPDIVHMHNLHGNYFDLRLLPRLSRQTTTVLTLHDAWLLSGHCAHSFDCERWKTGCGQCPDLTGYPAVLRDATAYNWRRKRRIFGRSRLYLATPSAWLMDKVNQSMVTPAIVESRVIPNGIDLGTFQPEDQLKARGDLGLPLEAEVLLFTANRIKRNVMKDYGTMRDALAQIATDQGRNGRRILFLGLGEDAPSEHIGQIELRFVPYQEDTRVVAQFYQAADVYIHAARADTFPNSVLEALACGVPVVATAVGGIPEQIEDGVTGFLVPVGDAEAMADRIRALLTDHDLLSRMGRRAADAARQRFDLNRQTDDYLAWYEEICECNRP